MGGGGRAKGHTAAFSQLLFFQCYAVSNDAGEPSAYARMQRTQEQSNSFSISLSLIWFFGASGAQVLVDMYLLIFLNIIFWRLRRPNFSGYASTHLTSYNFSAKKKPFETLKTSWAIPESWKNCAVWFWCTPWSHGKILFSYDADHFGWSMCWSVKPISTLTQWLDSWVNHLYLGAANAPSGRNRQTGLRFRFPAEVQVAPNFISYQYHVTRMYLCNASCDRWYYLDR